MAIEQRTATGTLVEESTTVVETSKLVGFWRRWTGLAVDALIISLIGIGISLVMQRDPFSMDFESTAGSIDFWLTMSSGVIYTFTLLLLNKGQTLGMQMVGIQLKQENEKPLVFTTVLVRWFGSILSSFALNIGYLWCAWDNKKQTWHDKMAGTLVVEKQPVATGLIITLFIASFLIVSSVNTYAVARVIKETWEQEQKKSVESGQDEAVKTETTTSRAEVRVLLDKSDELFMKIRTAGTEKEQALLNDQNIVVLQEATKLAPTDAQVWAQLSHAYTWSSSKGTVQDGVDAAAKALEFSPNDAGYMSTLGRFQIVSGKIPEGVLQLEKSVRADNTDPEAHYWLANGYYNLKIMDKAREHLNEAISLYEKDNQQGDHDERILMIRSELAKMQ